jgi:monovalent cation/hydrogen antiporter
MPPPVLLIAVLTALAIGSLLARPLRLPQPVVLALLGALLTLVPGLPRDPLDPALVLAFFLPPLLYADTFQTSWTDFRRWLRPILQLAVGLVAVTVLTVGVAVRWVLPELPWAACFLLGAIVSPTDTVAVQAVVSRLRLPRRLTSIVSGESLVNDATGLLGVQLGVAVLLTGAFDAATIAGGFARVAGGGVAVGLVVGAAFAAANRVVTERTVLLVLSLLAPYLAMHGAGALGCSGVLAVVVAGFVVAWRMHRVAPEARLELWTTWNMLVFVLNGLCFLYIGLEAPRAFREAAAVDGGSLLLAGIVVSAVVIATRAIWIVPHAYVPLWISPALRRREGGYPPWQSVVVASWCGARGAVSLAAALALPTMLDSGEPLPGRAALVACTIIVILVTLVLQASTLSPLIRFLGLREEGDTDAEVRAAREAVLEAGIRRLDAFCSEVSCPLAVHHWRAQLQDELAALREQDAGERAQALTRLEVSREVHRAVLSEQRAELLRQRDGGRIDDGTYVALELELDRRAVGR